MKLLMMRVALVLGLLSLLACQPNTEGTTTGNPFVGFGVTGSGQVANVTAKNIWQKLFMDFVPTAKALPPPSSLQDAAGNSVVISQFWMSISQVEFKYYQDRQADEVDDDSVQFVGPFVVDNLAASPTLLASGNISIASMRRVKVKIRKADSLPAGAPAGLSGKSIYLVGTVNGVPFTFSTQAEERMYFSGPKLIQATQNSNLLISIETANLIKSIDLSSITSSTDISDSNKVSGSNLCRTIDRRANSLFACFRSGIEVRSNFGRDNGDWELKGDDDTVK